MESKNILKKVLNFIIPYALSIIIANLIVGILSLIFKISLITVQGPTMITRISEIVTYYISLSILSFFLFRLYSKKDPQLKLKEILLFYFIIIILHSAIILFGEFKAIWLITTGSGGLTNIIYTGGGYIESIREIPKLYYFMPLVLEDICLITFSLLGYFKGYRKFK